MQSCFHRARPKPPAPQHRSTNLPETGDGPDLAERATDGSTPTLDMIHRCKPPHSTCLRPSIPTAQTPTYPPDRCHEPMARLPSKSGSADPGSTVMPLAAQRAMHARSRSCRYGIPVPASRHRHPRQARLLLRIHEKLSHPRHHLAAGGRHHRGAKAGGSDGKVIHHGRTMEVVRDFALGAA
jgi:hypothetical protein